MHLIALYKLYLVGSFFSVFLPGAIGGDIIRVGYSSDHYNLSLKKAGLIVLTERLCGLMAVLIMLVLGILYSPFIQHYLHIPIYYMLCLLILFLLVIPFSIQFMLRHKIAISYKYMLLLVLLSGIGQAGDILAAYFFAQYFELNISFTNLLFVMPLVYIATVVPISLGGLGVREVSMVGLLAIFSIPNSTAAILSLLLYLVRVLVGLIGLPCYLSIKMQLPKKT